MHILDSIYTPQIIGCIFITVLIGLHMCYVFLRNKRVYDFIEESSRMENRFQRCKTDCGQSFHISPEPVMSVQIPTNHLTLYVKAGWDGVGYGACPFCQRFYMVLDLKSKSGSLTYDVITVNQARPTQEFRKFANKLPVLKHQDEVISDMQEIDEYISANFPHPDLSYTNAEAHTVSLDIFSKFAFFVKEVAHTPEHLTKELSHINAFLDKAKTDYLCGDTLTNLDCNVLPKLQHIRVASTAFKDFEIPGWMKGLWRYLGNAYTNDTFKKTCPSDQEIVHHWSEKRETTPLPHDKLLFYTVETAPRFTLELPNYVTS